MKWITINPIIKIHINIKLEKKGNKRIRNKYFFSLFFINFRYKKRIKGSHAMLNIPNGQKGSNQYQTDIHVEIILFSHLKKKVFNNKYIHINHIICCIIIIVVYQ